MGEGDTGPNTGGMGSYSPAPVLTPDIERQVGATLPVGWPLLLCRAGVLPVPC